MHNPEYFKGKKVVIVGLARSGTACANLLFSLGAQVRITDNSDSALIKSNLEKINAPEIMLEMGRHTEDFIKGSDLMVVSPGVAGNALPVVWAKKQGIAVVSEIEVASMLCPGRIVAVTGSNGKTTVTTLLGEIIRSGKKRAFVCGNIGNPFCACVSRVVEGDYVVLEVSSFQLETIKDFKPKIAVMLNLTPNHLDRYNNMREYQEAKKRIFMNQDKNDFLVLNADDAFLEGIAPEAKSKIIFFDKISGLNPNQCAVAAVGKILGIEQKLILDIFKNFKGIEHRLEEVACINGVRFINDSKATTVDSAIWAISNIAPAIILIAGGRHKGIDYRMVLDAARNKVKQAILIGEAKDKIALALAGSIPVYKALTLDEAVRRSFANALPGDSVLFSPMCSSFDMFEDYQQRGRFFKQAVLKLAEQEKV